MRSHDRLTLYTVPSRHVRADRPPTPTPYRHVVGMEVGGVLLRSAEYPQVNADVLPAHYDLHEVLVQRLLTYFRRHFSENRLIKNSAFIRNCFHLGIWAARGIAYPSEECATSIMWEAARYTPALSGPPRSGELVIIRSITDYEPDPVLHCMAKLGEDEDFIHILCKGGNLAIGTVEEALAYRRTAAYQDCLNTPENWEMGQFSAPRSLEPDYP